MVLQTAQRELYIRIVKGIRLTDVEAVLAVAADLRAGPPEILRDANLISSVIFGLSMKPGHVKDIDGAIDTQALFS